MSLNPNDAVYFKTAKALEELADRRHGLRAKARQLLVMLDGSRTLGALNTLMAAHDLHALVHELKTSGFISHESTPVPPSVERPIRAALHAPVPAPSTEMPLDAVKLTRAKAYLIEICQQHLGLMAAKLQQEIAVANDAASLRATLAHWNMALRESRSGSVIANTCLREAHVIIGWESG